VEQIEWEAGTSRAAVAGIAMLSEEVLGAPRVTTDRVRAPAAAAVPRVWGLEEAVVVVAGGDVGKRPRVVERKSSEHGYEINICEGKPE
jgi:hypothetical protein